MPQQYTVTGVIGPTEWNGQYGPMHDYRLSLEGQEKAAVVTQKPTSPAPQQGQQVWLELSAHPKFQDLLKAKRVQPPDGQTSMAPRNGASHSTPNHDDATRRSIERQTSMRAATDLYHGTGHDPVEVVRAADIFFGWVSQ